MKKQNKDTTLKTMKTLTQTSCFAAVALFALAQASCQSEKSAPDGEAPDSPATESADAPPTTVDPKIEAVFLETAPEGEAASVVAARKDVKAGSTITVSGRIAGAFTPFSADYATLILADDGIMTCERNPGDMCPTPWDACCVEMKTLAASRLTVQVLGEDGRPVEQSLKLVRGLKELDGLIVTGTVAEGSSDENLILNATGIFPKKQEEKSN